jgi:hypothetical protein
VAKFAATDYDITIDTVDFSDSLAAVTLDISKEQLETTAFGDAARTYIAGLQDGSVTLSFHQDFAASAVDATLHAALGTEIAIVIKPTSAAVGAGNPSLIPFQRFGYADSPRFRARTLETSPHKM